MSDEVLLVEKTDHVAVLTLNRPHKLNALNAELRDAMQDAVASVKTDDDVRAVIFTGAGRGFCSGADLTGGGGGVSLPPTQSDHLDDLGWVGRQALAVYGLDKPVIGAVNGVAAGAGMSLALACDMRVGSEKARFKTVFIERNLSPDSGMSFFLPRIVGYSRAADLIYTSRAVEADEAHRIGLLDRLVDHDDLFGARGRTRGADGGLAAAGATGLETGAAAQRGVRPRRGVALRADESLVRQPGGERSQGVSRGVPGEAQAQVHGYLIRVRRAKPRFDPVRLRGVIGARLAALVSRSKSFDTAELGATRLRRRLRSHQVHAERVVTLVNQSLQLYIVANDENYALAA